MLDSTALLYLLALPLAGAILLSLVAANKGVAQPRVLAMLVMLAVLAPAVKIFFGYSGGGSWLDFNYPLIAALDINLHMAVDGFNVYLLLLTALLFPVVLGCTWNTAHTGSKLFLALLLILESSLLGTFLSQNVMMFFVFWEAVLIPMVILVLVFGGEKRRQAAVTFFLYTMAGSILLLAAVIQLGVESAHQTGRWSFEFATLYKLHLSWGMQSFIFGAIVLACAIKCPLFPFHSWLPLAYYEAPAAGTALMAGALSKMGAFAFLKLAVPLCPEVSVAMAPYLVVLAVISILYGAVLALKQEDYKKLVAYSSLSHMGYIVLGIFSLQGTAIHGAFFQILSHGLAVAGLFLMLGLLEQRLGSAYRQVTALSIIAPRFAVVLMLFILTTVALPLTSGFTAEFMILFGAFQRGLASWQAGGGTMVLVAVLAASSGMVLGAGYMLRFARVILYGKADGRWSIGDLNLREAAAFVPLLALIVWIGVAPSSMMNKAQGAVSQLAGQSAPARTTLLEEHAHGN